MNRKRIFIAINLPETVKKELSSYKSEWPNLPARWTKKESMHITLAFLGYLDDEQVFETCKISERVGGQRAPFSIDLNKIIYAPPGKMPPRMVWATGDAPKEFSALQLNLVEKFAESKKIGLALEDRKFKPHITLARIQTFEWRKFELDERPFLDKEIGLNFPVSSIEVMESRLKRGGAEYEVLQSCPLGGEILI